MAFFKCKMCGGELDISEGMSVAECQYCGTKQTLPKLDDGKKATLYDRANHFRRNNDFDKAMGIYEQILNEDNTDAEAYWSLVLCRYGIEYVEDPLSHKRMPTVNRAQFTSVYMDEDYKSALKYADGSQKVIYEQEAKAIDDIQKGILEISSKEEPFDVFICYKETDANGRRTQDSVLANDLYYQLTQEGFKVFFARITLEDKLGTAYEPYIFAALNSAKVMVVLGTRPEYFNAVWVKNEWSRYLALVKQSGGGKILVPAYRDMDPYDLPEDFSHLQAQDMSKLGFMQDLVRGIKKIFGAGTAKTVVKETVQNVGTDKALLLKRASLFLADGDWEKANEYCEKILDMDPECAEAYLYKLMADVRVHSEAELANVFQSVVLNNNYKKILQFGDDEIKNRISEIINSKAYADAIEKKESHMYSDALRIFEELSSYKDSQDQAALCQEKIEDIRSRYNAFMAAKRQEEERINQEYENAVAKYGAKLALKILAVGVIMTLFSLLLLLDDATIDYSLGCCFIGGGVMFIAGIIGIKNQKNKDYANETKELALLLLNDEYRPTREMRINLGLESDSE